MFCSAWAQMNSDVIVEVTGDCPLLDPELIDLAVDTFFANECDVVTNVRVPSFPQGADFQVFRRNDLAHVAATVDDPAVREHVSLYFYEHPERYRIVHVLAPPSLCAPNLRLQLDYPEDLQFIREVYARLEPALGGTFGVSAILELLEQEPALARINADCEEKPLR
jgi:spore coat polysaccharide biosynthesis protein SpsF